jgi:hypothetical protein
MAKAPEHGLRFIATIDPRTFRAGCTCRKWSVVIPATKLVLRRLHKLHIAEISRPKQEV